MTISHPNFTQCAEQLAAAGKILADKGLTPATSSNFSMRLDERNIAITISGRDKGKLNSGDIMLVDLDGKAVGSDHRPSAETLLHTQMYRRDAKVNVVLHTHSLAQTVVSRLCAKQGYVRIEGYELLKAFSGYDTHISTMDLPVFANTQNMPELVAQVDARLDADGKLHGYLIEGHGIYTWGDSMATAMRHIEAFEFLLNCELEVWRLTR